DRRSPCLWRHGVSFGGAAVLLASCHPKVKKVIALAPVIDWTVSGPDESFQTLREYTEGAFGGAYRGPRKNWEKLKKGNFYSPLHEIKKMNGQKILLFHAEDDRVVPREPVSLFAQKTGAKIIIKKTGGHLSSRIITYKRNWEIISEFLRNSL
ncbi:MAG: prolyl oligopeptidase family serine peptidase, partial [Candidatus Moraniibacteriota bacterium]